MKKLLLLLFAANIFLCYGESMPDFSTQIYFKDAAGNKDTITVGYSTLAERETLNEALGEINIPREEIDTTFFIYMLDKKWNEDFSIPFYRTKVKYTDSKEDEASRRLCLEVICKNFPIEITWEKEAFQDTMRSKSFITTQGHDWSDVGRYPLWIAESDTMILFDYYNKDNYDDYEKWHLEYYTDSIQGEPQKIGRLYLGFLKYNSWYLSLGTGDLMDDNLQIYPNPCKDVLSIRSDGEPVTALELYDSHGRLIERLNKNTETIVVSGYPAGAYFLKINTRTKSYVRKIIKN